MLNTDPMTIQRISAGLCSLLIATTMFGQSPDAGRVGATYEIRREMSKNSILREYQVRNIGPTVQGGRIVDLDVNHSNPREFYVAYASGGVFKTVNNGISFT